jgi:hypothetical protein
VLDSLLNWWQLSGHPRLWQLLSRTCSPVWQILLLQAPLASLGAGEAGAAQPQDQPTQAGPAQQASARTGAGSSSSRVAGTLPPGCVALCYCGGAPLDLARLLAQTPTRAALRQLLAALPGRCRHSGVDSRGGSGGGSGEASGGGDGSGDGLDCVGAGGGRASGRPSLIQGAHAGAVGGCGVSGGGDGGGWPSEAEWSLGWVEEEGADHAEAAEAVLAAWRLVMQHRSWYEYAAWLLAHSSMRLLTASPAAAAAAQQSYRLAPSQPAGPTREQQRQPAPRAALRDDALRDASSAADLLAWIVAPADPGRCALYQPSFGSWC